MPRSHNHDTHSAPRTQLRQAEVYAAMHDQIRQAVRQVIEATMREELTAFVQAQPYERSDRRAGQRNGYYQRDLITRQGTLSDLRVPRDRAGQFETNVFERFARYEPEVRQAIAEMFVVGVSTRKVERVTTTLLDTAPSPASVSRITHGLQSECTAWRTRQLQAHYPIVYLDGVYFPIVQGEHVVETPLLVALGVDPNGTKEVLALVPVGSESADGWQLLLANLKERGIQQVDLVISDGDAGLLSVLPRWIPTAKHQRCIVHKQRNVFATVGSAAKKELAPALKAIFEQPTRAAALEEVAAFRARYEASYPQAVACLLRELDSCLTFYAFPTTAWKFIRSTNALEGLFRTIRIRTDSMGAFRTTDSCLFIVSATILGTRLRRLPAAALSFLHST